MEALGEAAGLPEASADGEADGEPEAGMITTAEPEGGVTTTGDPEAPPDTEMEGDADGASPCGLVVVAGGGVAVSVAGGGGGGGFSVLQPTTKVVASRAPATAQSLSDRFIKWSSLGSAAGVKFSCHVQKFLKETEFAPSFGLPVFFAKNFLQSLNFLLDPDEAGS
ncbi:MAG: hypothetical protein ACYCW6_23735 [Candidatus Xenobia bacterium]